MRGKYGANPSGLFVSIIIKRALCFEGPQILHWQKTTFFPLFVTGERSPEVGARKVRRWCETGVKEVRIGIIQINFY